MAAKPCYKRVLLKLSGESFMGDRDFGINPKVLQSVASEIRDIQFAGVETGIVIGGGNFMRGASLSRAGLNRAGADKIGMLATVMNSVALKDILLSLKVEAEIFTPAEFPGVSISFRHDYAKKIISSGVAAIFAGGTGNPFFTTDTAACLRAIEIDADIVLKATRVDGVYDKDPEKFADAVLFPRLDYDEVITRGLQLMDLTAILLCRDHGMKVGVINMTTPGNLKQAIMSNNIGTVISN